jgi:hypothetical protein
MPRTAGQPVRELWPKRRVSKLPDWLTKRFPLADANVVGVAAEQIDGHIRSMLSADRRVLVGAKQRGRSVSLVVTDQPMSIIEALRALERNLENPKLYAKSWTKLPVDALALIEHAKGLPWADTMPGVTKFPIPTPAAAAPFIRAAIALASEGRRPKHWQRDLAVQEIARVFEQLTGKAPTQTIKGPFIDFLDAIEKFYNEAFRKEASEGSRPAPDFTLRFGVQRSHRTISQILRRPR